MSKTIGIVEDLFEGEIDIVGDIHGEYQAFCDLLQALGYDNNGIHPKGRRLVFVGDLVDRGPNSPQVVEDVMRMVDAGNAQCVLGNHELNILMELPKDGNGWLSEEYEQISQEKGWRYEWEQSATPEQYQRFLAFFATLPLGLERTNNFPLRVVHALWDTKKIQDIMIQTDIATDCRQKDIILKQSITKEEDKNIKEFKKNYDLHNEQLQPPPPMCHTIAEVETRIQMSNPIKVMTSGAECPMRGGEPKYLSGKFRMTERLPWWESYDEGIPVVFGHYWRTLLEQRSPEQKRLFKNTTYDSWLGKNSDTYCIDFSVGYRYKERRRGKRSGFDGQLGALRVPAQIDGTWTVVLSDGSTFDLPKIGT